MPAYYRLLLALLTAMPFWAAAQPAHTPADEIVLLNPKDLLPANAVPVGREIKIIDKGFKVNCTYNDVVADARKKVTAAGGNILRVIEWRLPGSWSTCYGLIGQAYYLKNIESLRQQIAAESDSVVRSLIAPTANYALLYVYRTDGPGPMVSYNVHLGDSTICRIHNDEYYIIPVHKEGKMTAWARTESRVEVPVDIHFGRAYFLKCGVSMGALVGHPMMRLVEPKDAVRQFKFDEVSGAKDKGEDDAYGR